MTLENHHWALLYHLPSPPGVPEALQENVAVSRHRQTYTTQFLRSVSGRAEIGRHGNTGSASPAKMTAGPAHITEGDLPLPSLCDTVVCLDVGAPSSRCLQQPMSLADIQPPPAVPLLLPAPTYRAGPAELAAALQEVRIGRLCWRSYVDTSSTQGCYRHTRGETQGDQGPQRLPG